MRIAFLGDMGLLGNYSVANNPSLEDSLHEVADYLSKFDYVVGNLESPFSVKRKPHGAKSAYLCTEPENIDVLRWLHVDAVTVANNHFYDFGKEGFLTTIQQLDKAGIRWFGADGKSLRVEADGNKLAFEGFCCYSTNPIELAPSYGANGLNRFDLGEVEERMKANANDGYLNVMCVHAGIEHVNFPSVDQIRLTRQLAGIMPIVYVGHHPHVVQGIEPLDKSVIAHSLGNFCFAGNEANKFRPQSSLSDNNRQGMIFEVEVVANSITSHKETLIHIGEDGTIRLLAKEATKHILQQYNDGILTALDNVEQYTEMRRAQRSEYLAGRRQLRDFKWLLSHLRPRYARLYLSNRSNAQAYQRCVKAQIR